MQLSSAQFDYINILIKINIFGADRRVWSQVRDMKHEDLKESPQLGTAGTEPPLIFSLKDVSEVRMVWCMMLRDAGAG